MLKVNEIVNTVVHNKMNDEIESREWEILFTNAKKMKVEKGDVLIKEGEYFPYLYLIESGELEFEKNYKSIGKLDASGYILGDLSVFHSSFCSFFTISAKTQVIFQRLNVPFIFCYLIIFPDFAIRFFNLFCRRFSAILSQSTSYSKSQLIHLNLIKVKKSLISDSFYHPLLDYFPLLSKTPVIYGLISLSLFFPFPSFLLPFFPSSFFPSSFFPSSLLSFFPSSFLSLFPPSSLH